MPTFLKEISREQAFQVDYDPKFSKQAVFNNLGNEVRFFYVTLNESDFAEALMGHKSLKLVYYRQNEKARAQTYLDIEHSLTIAETEKLDQNYIQMKKDNQELRGIVDSLSRQLQNLEKKIEFRI